MTEPDPLKAIRAAIKKIAKGGEKMTITPHQLLLPVNWREDKMYQQMVEHWTGKPWQECEL